MAMSHRVRWVVMGMGVLCALTGVSQWITALVVAHGTYVCNTGIAMSISLSRGIFVGAWSAVVGALAWVWWHRAPHTRGDHAAFLLIFAGALSNVCDRMVYGCVVDYLPFFSLSMFNLADVWITCGALFIAWRAFFGGHHSL